MNLYLISQTEVRDYDTYSEAVVSAENEDEARRMHPAGDGLRIPMIDDCDHEDYIYKVKEWANDPNLVTAKYLGRYIENKTVVICASFHAG